MVQISNLHLAKGGVKLEPKGGPHFVRYFGPVIKALQVLGGSGRPAEVRELVAEMLDLSSGVLDEQMASGSNRFENQVAWARFYLAKADFIDSSNRGVWALTEKALAVPDMSHEVALKLFREVHRGFEPKVPGVAVNRLDIDDAPPETSDEPQTLKWRQHLITLIQSLPPAGFERLCQRLLRESGFENVTVTGRSGDGGLDGIGILEANPFVSFKVLFQCKRYAGSVSPSQVRDFRGAMQGRTDKGIILTTGTFTTDAKKEAIRDGVPAIELVDGDKLVEMFEKLELGLKPRTIFEVDERFFDQFQA
jgi:restriction system protein